MAATRVEDSGIGRKISVSIFGRPGCQYFGLAFITIRSSFTHSWNIKGPVPTGFALKPSSFTSAMYLGGTMAQFVAIVRRSSGLGLSVLIFTVRSSTFSTDLAIVQRSPNFISGREPRCHDTTTESALNGSPL